MNQPRDVDLAEWLDGIGFHPANTPLKQTGHELARSLVALVGTHLHQLLPPGRDKSLAFTHLEDLLMRANRALALNGGPRESVALDDAQALLADLRRAQALIGAQLPDDPRIDAYKAEQRGEAATGNQLYGEAYTQEPLPDEAAKVQEYDGTVTTDDQEIVIDLHASVASGRVQIGVLCTNPKRVEDAFTEGGTPNSPQFDGFYAGFTSPDHLAAFLRETSAAGQVAFGQ
jgi:hypothetical protein